MKRLLALAGALALAGCGAFADSRPDSGPGSARLLQRADDQMVAAQYRGALALYDEFLKAHPGDPATARVRASRTVIERLLIAQTEVERLRREVDTRKIEIERFRQEVDTRQTEIDRLKADLERLRRIDLRQAPAAR